MKQSKLMSWVETCLNTAIGFGVAILAQILIFPLFGFSPPLSQNFMIAGLFTVVSIVRGYCLRRLFEALHIRTPMPASILAIAAERRRQIDVEGWTPEHDDEHALGEMSLAAGCYAQTCWQREHGLPTVPSGRWPWERDWWKPQDNRRDLVRAGALVAAELDKMDRLRKRRVRS